MQTGSIVRSHTTQRPRLIASEAGLLELFAPTRPPPSTDIAMPRSEHARLWRADAIHRAKNMAQMTASLVEVAENPTRGWLPPEVTSQARRLSRAYEELSVADEAHAPVPCAALLTDIATRLADIFGRSRQIVMTVCAQPVLLPPDVRRALILIGSELVINALKYAYPSGSGGTISVSLGARFGEVEMTVEDDGVGVAETYSAGNGGGLLEQLQVVLGATLTRTTGGKGHGFRVSISIPIEMPQGKVS